MLLTDVAVEHTQVSKKTGVRQPFVLHPFTDTQRDSLGKFERVLDEFNCYVRMCPAQGKYPGANPAKKLPPDSIRVGSPFDMAVAAVDVSKPASRELRTVKLRINVKLQGGRQRHRSCR